MKIATFILIFVPFFCFSICAESNRTQDISHQIEGMYSDFEGEFPDVPAIDAAKAKEFIKTQNSVLIDVRTSKEQEVSMIPGAITKDRFERNKGRYRKRKIVAYCTIGYRSGQFVAKLKKEGFEAYNLRGGILAWINSGQFVVDHNGQTLRVHVYGKKWNLLPPTHEAIL